MMPKKQYTIIIFCIYFSTLAITLIMSSPISAAVYSWDNYRKPFGQTLKVPLFGGTQIAVTLPADCRMYRDTINLHFDIVSSKILSGKVTIDILSNVKFIRIKLQISY